MIFHGCNLKSQGLYSSCLASRDRHDCMSRQTDTQTHIHTNTVEYSSIHTTNTYKGILHYTNTQLRINTLSHSWYTHTTHHTKTDRKIHTSLKFLLLFSIFLLYEHVVGPMMCTRLLDSRGLCSPDLYLSPLQELFLCKYLLVL